MNKNIRLKSLLSLTFVLMILWVGIENVWANFDSNLALADQPPLYAISLFGDAITVTGMNENGDIVGWTTLNTPQRGFIAGPNHPYELLPLPEGFISSWARDINDAGIVVGSIDSKAAMWIPKVGGGYTISFLGALPGHTESFASAINNQGDIVGTSIRPGFSSGPSVWFNSPGGILDITSLGAPLEPQAINDNRILVGFDFTMFDLDTLLSFSIPSGTLGGTAVLGLNNHDELAGYAVSPGGLSRFAVRWTVQDGWQQLGGTTNASGQVAAYDINDDGVTVMETVGPGLGHHVAVHFNDLGTFPLASLIAPDQGNWVLIPNQGEAINNSGQIAVIARNMDTFEAGVALLTPLTPVHIGDLDGSANINGKKWAATVTVSVHNEADNPVASATVTGTWSNVRNGIRSCTTDASGTCNISESFRTATSSATFTINTVTHSTTTYNPAANHDPDGDSDGTSITVIQAGPPDNQPPEASFTYSCSDLMCTFDGSGSSDADGSIIRYDWEFGDGTTASGITAGHTYGVPGTYIVILTVTDDDGDTGMDTQIVTLGSPGGALVHVGDLDGLSTPSGNKWIATMFATIHDENENPVSDATVTGTWGNGAKGKSSCTTAGNGQCAVTKNLRNAIQSVTFTVTEVVANGFTYESGSNHDPDGDSNGTTITITR